MKVDVRHGNIEQALRILKRKVQKEGIIRIAREKEFYEKPTAKRQRIKKQNIKNVRKQESKTRLRPKPHRRTYS
jgi:small subunit ribosomal protein S21